MLRYKIMFSWIVGIVAAFLAFGQFDNLDFIWLQFAAWAVLIAILKWNHVIEFKIGRK